MTEYIMVEKTQNNGWCLWLLLGTNLIHAINELQKEQSKHPEKMLKVVATEKEKNWWNDPSMVK